MPHFLASKKNTDTQTLSSPTHRLIYFLVVKSVSRFDEALVSDRLQLHASMYTVSSIAISIAQG